MYIESNMTRQQRLVLIVAILASFVAFLDIAVVNVALPAIRKEFGAGLASQQWIVDAYLITLGSLILIAGSISDLFGRKKVLRLGLMGFAVTSLLCALAPNASFLIACRALQGVAGALLVRSSLAVIIANFSGKAEAKAIGSWTAWSGTIAFIIGPLVGGLLVDNLSWRWIFGINLAPIALTLWLMHKVTAVDSGQPGVAVDVMGAVLCALGLGGAVYSLIEEPRIGWSHPSTYLPLMLGVLLLPAFIYYERHAPHPMLPLHLFARRNFRIGNIATLFIYAGLTAVTFLLIVFVQQVGGYSAFASGFALLPVTILMFSLSTHAGALAGKFGPRWFMTAGPFMMALGLSFIALRVTSHVTYLTQILPGIIVFGVGLATMVAPLTAAILGDVAKEHAGIGSAVNNALSRIAGLIAVAGVGAFVAVSYRTALTHLATAQSLSSPVQTFITQAKERPLDVSTKDATESDKAVLASVLHQASVSAFRRGMLASAALVATGGLVSAIGITNKTSASEEDGG